MNLKVILSGKIVLLGAHYIQGITRSQRNQINKVIAVGKMAVSKYKFKKEKTIEDIYLSEADLRSLWGNFSIWYEFNEVRWLVSHLFWNIVWLSVIVFWCITYFRSNYYLCYICLLFTYSSTLYILILFGVTFSILIFEMVDYHLHKEIWLMCLQYSSGIQRTIALHWSHFKKKIIP